MNKLFPTEEGRNWPLRLGKVYSEFGITGKAYKLPQESLPVQLIQGVPVWVEAAPPKTSRKSSKHRTMAACPKCGFICSLGRMHQHAKIHSKS